MLLNLLCWDDYCKAAPLESRIQEFWRIYFRHHAAGSSGKILILSAHYGRVTRSLIESQKINALFGDKQLTQISPWINLLLSSHCSADRLPRSGREGWFDQAPFLSFKPDISLIDNLRGGEKKMAGVRLKLAPWTVITIYILF